MAGNVKIINKSVAIKRPHNILNSAPDADRRLNTNIKGLVFWWSGLTLFYLWSGLEIDVSESSFLGIHFENFTEQTFEQKFLTGLLILNSVFWVRLLWRILISIKYNKYYDDAVEKSCQEENPKAGTVEKYYEENMKNFNMFEKWGIGLLIPIGIGLAAIIWLSHRLIFVCLQWPKIVFCLEIALLVIVLLVVLVTLYCEYCREIEKECILCKTIKDSWSKIKGIFNKLTNCETSS